MDTSLISKLFVQRGYVVSVQKFSEIDFTKEDYKGVYILYQSSEDPGLRYKDYIEDVLLGLKLQGAILIPDFYKFRAHHNKVFMEIYRDVVINKRIDTGVQSKYYGTLEDYISDSNSPSFPSVLKPSEGSRSRGISLLKQDAKSLRAIRKLSFSPTIQNAKRLVLNIFDRKGFKKMSHHRKKFILQSYIPELHGDFKVLVYSNKYFVLWRENRANDFRASGSGKLSFPSKVPVKLLDFVKDIYKKLDVPYLSIDVARSGSGKNYLFEFQFLMFGQYALEKSKYHFVLENNKWRKVHREVNLENEFVKSIDEFIRKKRP